MPSKTKRTLEELLARYELHPDVCDIYVEGESDKDILRWFFDSSGKRNIVVYPITEVDIAAERVNERKLANNNRGRVMLLAAYLKESLDRVPTVTCVIDADLDYALEIAPPTGLLLRTDFSSMDMYGYDDAAVLKTSRLLGCDLNRTGADILNELSGYLLRLFLYRLVSHILKLELQWIAAHKCCTLRGTILEFDEAEFLRRYLNKKGLGAKEKAAFEEELKKYEEVKGIDVRLVIRGHDFTETLAWYFSHHISRPPHPDARLVRRMLFASLSFEQLGKHALFAALLKRTSACS